MPTILTEFDPRTLALANEANMVAQFAYYAGSPLAEVEITPELLRYRSGIPIAEYNGVIDAHFPVNLAPAALAARVEAVIAYFAAHRQAFQWWLGPTTTPRDFASVLVSYGFEHLGAGPGMVADLRALDDDTMPPPPDLMILPVTDAAALRDWVAVAGLGYGEPETILQARYDVHVALGLGADLPLQRYVAYRAGRPVAMSALFLGAGVAGVYEVATARDARRQGIGTAVTAAPLRRARELGYRISVLQASPMGVSVYTRLGFRQVCTYALYGWAPERTSAEA